MMNTISVCLAILIGFISIIGVMSVCYNFPGAPCIHNNRAYSPGKTWDNGLCQECTCHRANERRGYHCCNTFSVPIYDMERCEAVFDNETCSFTLHRVETATVDTSYATTEATTPEAAFDLAWSSFWTLPSWLYESTDDEQDCLLFSGGVGK